MKKLVSKLRAKKQPQEPVGRITTDTLAEHRERVLAGGRKFKYPVQYQRHKLVVNALIIGAIGLVLLIALMWYLLYVAKNTSEFMYRVTKVVPVPVAVVDGQQVRYSDYLMKYRSTAHYLVEKEQIDERSEDGKNRLSYVKSQALDDAIADAYAEKLARELDITVTEADIEERLKLQRQEWGVTETTFNAVVSDYYGWSTGEYRDAMKSQILRQKVSFAVDSDAENLSKQVVAAVKGGNTDLATIAESFNAKKEGTATYIPANWVSKTNQDGGLAEAAAKLEKGQVSPAVKTTSGNGYYYVKLLDSNDTQVNFEYIFIPLREFDAQITEVTKDDALTRFITLEKPDAPATEQTKNQE
ncbi:MAG: SurA N-terminal domain-containing protein [Candidatus Microsaccharimonas sp.]